ncbi:F420H2 dehydrogenase subunit FpoI [Methanolobus bombayensis]|uniref:F420H2 dehydrogenase subunit FpoI n=1 Tax=Methanolobus bombayensis TaxID=38023 RepID=UPI001AE7BC64|nr:F420H2 dehydrogenase subunit FpoI [Methanolobus bombayensis]MBP1908905.1 NADH-quinone oxidoreductase subunit I [Methanolobus bombayensis]
MVIKNIITAVKNIYFGPPVTRQCPEVPTKLSDRFRGLQKLDKTKCIGCGICANTCPNNCIKIVRARVSPDSDKQRWFPEIDIGHCLFCGLCISQCPKDALESSKVYLTGVIRWNHEDLLFTPDMLAREIDINAEEEAGEEVSRWTPQ